MIEKTCSCGTRHLETILIKLITQLFLIDKQEIIRYYKNTYLEDTRIPQNEPAGCW